MKESKKIPFHGSQPGPRNHWDSEEESSLGDDFAFDTDEISSSRKSCPLALDFAGMITRRPPRPRCEEKEGLEMDTRPTMPSRRRGASTASRDQWSENDSVASNVTRRSLLEQDAVGMSTLDMVLGKRYGSDENGFRHNKFSTRSSNYASREAMQGEIHETVKQGYNKNEGLLNFLNCGDDSNTSAPDPPALREDRHYSPPGAFRVSSTGFEQEGYNNDLESLINDSVGSNSALEILEAHLVTHELQADTRCDDDCADRAPAPPNNFTVSMGDITMMTQGSSATASSPVVEALPIDEIMTVKAFFRSRAVRCCLFVLGLVFMILALGTAYGVRVYKEPFIDPPPKKSTTSAIDIPTSAPTARGDLELEYFANFALPPNTRSALVRGNSPQSKALRWLRNNTFLEDYTLSRRLQRFALATFYFSTGGERRWTNKNAWLSDDDECTWFTTGSDEDTSAISMICDDLDGDIRRLQLAQNDLRGTLPVEVSLLTSLELIDLSGNLLTGFIPTSVGELSSLREIDLFDNYLSGTIPRELGEATNLEIINLEFNILAQIIPETLGELGLLRELRLARNALRGSLPHEIGWSSMLETFDASSNFLSGTIPSSFGSLSKLTSFRLESNQLSGSIVPGIRNWKKVTDLNLGNNTLTGSIPSEIGELALLTHLDLFANRLSGSIPVELGRLANIDLLYLEKNKLGGRIPTELAELKRASRLWLFGNELVGSIPTELGGMERLAELDFSQNQLSGEVPAQLGHLSSLVILSLEDNDLNGKIPSELGLLSNLQQLSLYENEFSGLVAGEICFARLFGELVTVTVDCDKVLCACCSCDESSSNFGF